MTTHPLLKLVEAAADPQSDLEKLQDLALSYLEAPDTIEIIASIRAADAQLSKTADATGVEAQQPLADAQEDMVPAR
jgi:hypothetical protein